MGIEKLKNTILLGDVLAKLKEFPDACVDCVITSPPYWNLRNYRVKPSIWDGKPNCKHDWNSFVREARGGGTKSAKVRIKGTDNFQLVEASQQAFCSKCPAWRGCLGLEPTFSLFIKHLADIFDEIKRVLKPTGSAWVVLGDTYSTQGGQNRDTMKVYSGYKSIRLDNKMMGVPLIKSKELPSKSLCQIPSRFAIEMTNRGWILRNELIWFKPNCMPSSATDRFTIDFEKVYFFVKSKNYYFKQQFEVYAGPLNRWGGEKLKANGTSKWDFGTKQKTYRERNMRPNPLGRNKRCVWEIPTRPFSGTHFAAYPEALIEVPIKAGCPKGGIVLDPFIGSGTTAVVARKLGRNYVGIELNPKYISLAEKRLAQIT